MKYVSATEAKQHLGNVLDTAQREPVVIRKQKRDVAVVLSMQDYQKLTASNREDFNRFCLETSNKAIEAGLTETILNNILAESTQPSGIDA